MPTFRKLRFIERIDAPVARVWDRMFAPDSYREWTSAFSEGSYFEGSWEQGATIRFLGPSGDGILSTIAENRHHAFVSIRHLAPIVAGVAQREGEAAQAWAGALENYTFRVVDGGTELTVDQDMVEAYEADMREAWPKALRKLKDISEKS